MRLLTQITSLMVLLCLCFNSWAGAFTFRLSQQDLNQVVGMAFPQTEYYQGNKVVFSNPYITLAKDNHVAIRVDISGTQDQQALSASATLSGDVDYDGESGVLQVIRPQLDGFQIHESNQIDESEISRWAEMLKGQSAPVILLLDFNQLDLSFIGNRVPSRMWVEKEQLVIEY